MDDKFDLVPLLEYIPPTQLDYHGLGVGGHGLKTGRLWIRCVGCLVTTR
jgi:hypothetical protein